MKTVGPGGRGRLSGCIRASRGVRFPFFRLQGAQEATMFSHTDSPPRLRGITWSTVRLVAFASVFPGAMQKLSRRMGIADSALEFADAEGRLEPDD